MANRFVTSARLISVGQTYGNWTVIEVASPSSLCRCKCGTEGRIRNSWMVAGRIQGGCHGCANKRARPGRRAMKLDLPPKLYGRLGAVVRNVLSRCTDPNHPHWNRYGGRGISVLPEWVDNPAKFVRYLTTLPNYDDPSLVIDRRNNDGNYEPGNLRFVTRSVSQRNKGSKRVTS